jgi:hypothetical protein
MTEPTTTEGLPVWRPGTPVRYWLDTREGDGQTGLTNGSPFVVDGVPAVFIAGHEFSIPLTRVEALNSGTAGGPRDGHTEV